MRRGVVIVLAVLAVAAWSMPQGDQWLLGFPLPQLMSLALAGLASLALAAPWIRAEPVTAFLSAWVAVIVLALTMITVSPIFLIGTAAAVLHWALRRRRQPLRS